MANDHRPATATRVHSKPSPIANRKSQTGNSQMTFPALQPFCFAGWTIPFAFLGSAWFLLATASAHARSRLTNDTQRANGHTLTDENAAAPDWIELYNPGSLAVTLDGWGLSDSTNSLFKWTFTNATLAPHSFLLVFASGK